MAKHTKILLIFFWKQWKCEPGKWSEKDKKIILEQTYTHSRTMAWLRIYEDETKGSMNKRDILMVCKMILQYLSRIFEEKWKQYEFFKETTWSLWVREALQLFIHIVSLCNTHMVNYHFSCCLSWNMVDYLELLCVLSTSMQIAMREK